MPIPFPPLIQWHSAYSVGIDSIDSQHKLLVSMIRLLQEAMQESNARSVATPLFQAMHEYTKVHFAYEEQLLEEHGYAELASHKALHAAFLAKLQEFEQKHAAGALVTGAPLMQFLRTWLIDHICSSDKAYAGLLKEKGVV